MLNPDSKHVRDCHARAAECRQRANAASDDDARAFWREEEARWLQLAESKDLTPRAPASLEPHMEGTFSPEAQDAVATLVRVFNRACLTLALDLSDETVPRKLARTIIEAALDGESDPEALFQRAMKAVSN